MSQSESFDAFYARTSWNVTSQMHALAGEDPLADHAIREAYAKAYQQWYAVSAYPDTEAWVLGVAKDAYQRRQAEAGAASGMPAPASGHDPLSWPGMFRPARPKAQPLSDPEATLAPRYGAPADPRAVGPVATPGSAIDGQMAAHDPALAGSGPPAHGSVAADNSPTASAAPADRAALGDAAAGAQSSAGVLPSADGLPSAGGPTWTGDPLAPAGGPSSATPQAEAPPGSLFGSRPPGDLVADRAHTGDAPSSGFQNGGALAGGALAGGALAGGRLADRPPADGALGGGALADGLGAATAEWAPVYGGAVAGDPAYGDGAYAGGASGAGARTGGMPTATIGDRHGSATTAGWRGSLRPDRPGGRLVHGLLGSRRRLVVFATVVAVVLAGGIAYALSGGNPGKAPGAVTSHGPVAKPTVHMLAAGQTGSRRAIPWSLIGAGWTLAEVSTAQPTSNPSPSAGGSYITYLVDPEGGKYRIRITSGAAAPDLLAWSGDAREALYVGAGTQTYGLLKLSSGAMTPLSLPAGVTPVGFTRPDGLNILAVQQKNSKYRLERYDLGGVYQAMIGSLPRPAGATSALQGNAVSSPDGTTAVWGVSGDEMQLVSNAGGLVRRLRVPGTGSRPSCAPISWWSSDEVLAYCNAGAQPDAGRLWLVPVGGSHPTQLTGISGSPSGQGDLVGAWQAGSAVYITSTTFAQCPGVASGPGGEQILQLSQGGVETPVSIPASTNHHASVVAGVDGRLLVLAQTSCPGTSSLIWFNPSTHTSQSVLAAPATEVGVISALPYGSGPAATAG